MKAQSPKPMEKMSYMKTDKFKPAKKIAEVKSFKNKRESQLKAVAAKKPVYKSGRKDGKPMNYATSKKGIITSID